MVKFDLKEKYKPLFEQNKVQILTKESFVIAGGNQHLLKLSSVRQLRFIILAIMTMNFSSFAFWQEPRLRRC